MRKIEELSVVYVGYKIPENADEIEMEIRGLETVIKNAELRIATLKQSLHLSAMMAKAMVEGGNAQENISSAQSEKGA